MADFPLLDDALRDDRLVPPSGVIDVVIDTDVTNEIDDQFAIVWAALRPDRINLVGLHACPYSLSPSLVEGGALLTPLDERRLTKNLEALGVSVDQIPVVPPETGVRRARRELERMADLLGLDHDLIRTGADRYLPDARTPVVSEATEHLVELARAATEPIHVVAIGAATNVASALLHAPEVAESIVVSWTSAFPSFWPRPNASYNLAQDLHAVRVLFDSGVPLHYLPGYYVGEELRVTHPEMAHHLDGVGEIGQFLFDLYDRAPMNGDHHGTSKVIWDVINIGWLLDPTWFTWHRTPAPVLGDDLRWEHPPGRHEIIEALDVDRDAIFKDLYRVVAEAAER